MTLMIWPRAYPKNRRCILKMRRRLAHQLDTRRPRRAEDLLGLKKKSADVEEINEGQWREFDEANIQSDIINQRQIDIDQIEQLMHQVNAITNDMAQEVANADSKLDQIGANARSTKENTKKALIDIHKGSEYQKKSYKRICCVVWLLILGLGVAATIIVLVVVYKQFFLLIIQQKKKKKKKKKKKNNGKTNSITQKKNTNKTHEELHQKKNKKKQNRKDKR
eukprot:TRINITY_DN2770_c0_g1_i3.p1 TRINITY_DN2770_c0_g1~~TRINITY_DN2770_c0_g1_i3.p1  ORF type:complete len:222 (-),score=49.68 TRINITY_DN2770_c0_g1_i3:6-671(-)